MNGRHTLTVTALAGMVLLLCAALAWGLGWRLPGALSAGAAPVRATVLLDQASATLGHPCPGCALRHASDTRIDLVGPDGTVTRLAGAAGAVTLDPSQVVAGAEPVSARGQLNLAYFTASGQPLPAPAGTALDPRSRALVAAVRATVTSSSGDSVTRWFPLAEVRP